VTVARTVEGARLTAAHRRQLLALRAATLRDLLVLWRMVDVTDLSGTINRWALAAALLARERNRAAGGLAARYLELFRRLEGLPGTVPVELVEPPPVDEAAGELRGAALSGIINARRAGQSVQAAANNGLVKASGTMTSLVLDGARQTVLQLVQRDREALGWQRVTSGDPCPFCRMLASRGAVYKSRRTAEFEAHDHCSCTVEPYYEGSRLTDQALTFRAEWQRAQREAREEREAGITRRKTANDALNAYRRYLARQRDDA